MVPNIKDAGNLNFQEYLTAFDDLVSRARTAKLAPADFQGTTLSLTNPGTVGTMSSTPRLMLGQGAIIATGAIDYPAEYRGAAEETRAVARHQQGDDDHLHLRSPHHSGRRIRRVPGQGAGTAGRQRRILRGDFRAPAHAAPAGALGRRPAVADPRTDGGALCRDRQGSRHHPDDQRVSRARASHRRPRSRWASSPATTRSSIRKPTASPSGTSTANSSPARWAKRSARAAPSR